MSEPKIYHNQRIVSAEMRNAYPRVEDEIWNEITSENETEFGEDYVILSRTITGLNEWGKNAQPGERPDYYEYREEGWIVNE